MGFYIKSLCILLDISLTRFLLNSISYVPTRVVKLLLPSLYVEALLFGVLCGVFISLFLVTFLWVCTHVLTLCQIYYSGCHYLLCSFVLLLVP
jgi:hypothetical protein